MHLRGVTIGLLLSFLGYYGLAPLAAEETNTAAARLWAAGQAAMRAGRTDQAIVCYEQSLQSDPAYVQSHLSLAAACLEKGQEIEACSHLQQYIDARPEQFAVRAYFAELLLRLRRTRDARDQFERCDADAQEQGNSAIPQLIRCHSRLTRIAEAAEDEYAEHMHRGIGLYYIARERADLPEPDGELSTEGLLFQAASELARARVLRPDEARPCWYLYEVWSQLAQRQPARRYLRAADEAAPFSVLTPAEQRKLRLACQGEAANHERP